MWELEQLCFVEAVVLTISNNIHKVHAQLIGHWAYYINRTVNNRRGNYDEAIKKSVFSHRQCTHNPFIEVATANLRAYTSGCGIIRT